MTIMSCEFESHFLHEEKIFAEIAQLVEHNLAKVRVASSSLVFRSCFFEIMELSFAQVAELVDAHVSGACVERHAGSSPVLGTKVKQSVL